MVNIQVLDSTVLNKITYKRFTSYLSENGWSKYKDTGEVEIWSLGDRQVIVTPSIYYSNYLTIMRDNLEVMADVLGQSQICIVAAMLGEVKVAVEGNDVIHWREWYVTNDDAEIKVVLYKNIGFLPYEDGDKIIEGTQMNMEVMF